MMTFEEAKGAAPSEHKRVLLVNTVVGTGSVGRLTEGLYDALSKEGYDCLVAYGRGVVREGMNAYRIGTDADVCLHGLKARLADRHGFASKKATKRFIDVIEDFGPDVIHLHNIHGYYLHIGILFRYLKEKKVRVIWTLHDCWAFTGHCAHFEYVGCEKWLTGCQACEQLSEYPRSILKDQSEKNYKEKKELFTGLDNMTLVTPSEWLSQKVKQSFLKEYPVVVLPTGIDLEAFGQSEQEGESSMAMQLRRSYHLEGKKVLLGVANPWRERKGFSQFLLLAKKLSDDYALMMVGLTKAQMKGLPEGIIGIGHTDSIKELAAYYEMADIYLNLTLEDTFPTTNIEALAAGTPVVTYASGGSSESIDETCGINVNKGSLEELITAIDTIISCKGASFTSKACKKRAENYDQKRRFEEYIKELYERN